MVRRPAKVEDVESHSGAETIPVLCMLSSQRDCIRDAHSPRSRRKLVGGRHAVLYEDVQALLDGQRCIEHDKSETERKDIIAGTDFEEVANGTLQD